MKIKILKDCKAFFINGYESKPEEMTFTKGAIYDIAEQDKDKIFFESLGCYELAPEVPLDLIKQIWAAGFNAGAKTFDGVIVNNYDLELEWDFFMKHQFKTGEITDPMVWKAFNNIL